MTNTAIYCAYQHKKYLYLALISALEFHYHNPDIPVYILTDLNVVKRDAFREYNITIINTNNQLQLKEEKKKDIKGFNVHGKFNNRQIKLQTYQFLPQFYDTYLFIDADILPLAPCSVIWNLCDDKNPIAFALESAKTLGEWAYYNQTEEGTYTQTICKPTQTSYNSGVFVYNHTAINDGFFDTWVDEWKRFTTLDQLALARTITTRSYPVVTLHEKYNYCPSKIKDRTTSDPAIVFLHLRKWIVPHDKLPSLYQKHCKLALQVLENIIPLDEVFTTLIEKT